MSSWFFIVLAGLFSTSANILIKRSVDQGVNLSLIINPLFISGLILFGLNLVFFILALKNLDVSKSYPVLAAISFLSLQIASIYFLGEQTSAYALFGVGFIILGIYLLTIQ